MKQTITGVILAGIFLLILTCSMVVSGKSVRQNEIDRTIDTAVEQTVAELKNDGISYSSEAYMADLMEGLLIKISSDSEMEVSMMGYDADKGLLSIEVTAHYQQPGGADKTVKTERTVVMENYSIY